ncbi:MAG: aminomethyl-transferring glycine dehydrogenase subunit GcvPA [Candidatus Cloacimonetes bacterium]|nr:aminomethyl-transferring glycine dehydrogenase subunit GcvPA [Candidatus Cloacimonadota bacterium]
MPYISNTDKERQEMLQEIGVSSFDELLQPIPEKLRLKKELKMDEPLSELEILRKVNRLANKNTCSFGANSFLGGGVYDHFIPAAVDSVVSKPDFFTAYTPYQAEVSQGTLQYIYEYQSMICNLTGMEVANASMYDAASALAEAILMAVRKTKLNKAVIAGTIHPNFKEVIKCYTEGIGVELVYIAEKNGLIDLEALKKAMDAETACVILQTPNFYGNIEDAFAIEEIVHAQPKAMFIVSVDPISLAILNSPAEYKADVVVGEGQALGNAVSYGGPLFGFFATNSIKNARTMPGRIVGGTLDSDGKKAYCLTLQAREQHIKRERATSNICSNQSLCVLAATVYMSVMGKEGLKEVAIQSTTKAHYLADSITNLNGFSLAYPEVPFFKEFVVNTPVPAEKIVAELAKHDIYAGISLAEFGKQNQLMIAVTEKKSKADMDAFVKALVEVK